MGPVIKLLILAAVLFSYGFAAAGAVVLVFWAWKELYAYLLLCQLRAAAVNPPAPKAVSKEELQLQALIASYERDAK